MSNLERKMRRRAERAAAKATAPGMGMAFEPVSAANSGTGQDELYMVLNGERIAYRGHPGTPEARKWVSLRPDFVIHNHEGPEPTTEAEERALLGLPDDTPIIDGGEVRVFPEPTGSVQ